MPDTRARFGIKVIEASVYYAHYNFTGVFPFMSLPMSGALSFQRIAVTAELDSAAFSSNGEQMGGGEEAVESPDRKDGGFERVDLLGMSAGLLLSLLVSYAFGRGRIFWEDEMLGWMLLRDPSWHHMLTAWKLGADGGGFSFYLTGRLWFAVFGPSDVSFRMYSATCFGLAFIVLWAAARHFYPLRVVAFALFNTFFFSAAFLLHMAEGRFYGLLILSTAVTVWIALLPITARERVPVYLYVAIFLAHTLLTSSHLLGIVYSFFVLAAMAATDWQTGRLRPLLYASGAASWLFLILERTAIRASAQVGKPHFWTTPPDLRRLVGVYTAFSGEIAGLLLILAILLCLTMMRSSRPWGHFLREAYQERRPVWMVTAALFLVPIAFLVEGLTGTSLFINRYLMPVTIAQLFLTAELICLIEWKRFLPALFRPGSRNIKARWIFTMMYAAALLTWIFVRNRAYPIQQLDYTGQLTATLPKGVPVVYEDAWGFTEVIGRQHASGVDYLYVLDWVQSVSDSAPKLEVTQYHLMENWRKAGYFAGSIMTRDELLAQGRDFLVVHTEAEPKSNAPPPIGNPLAQRFAHTPGYEVRIYELFPRKGMSTTVSLVCRGYCDPSGKPRL